jgi:hypothetical protein
MTQMGKCFRRLWVQSSVQKRKKNSLLSQCHSGIDNQSQLYNNQISTAVFLSIWKIINTWWSINKKEYLENLYYEKH